MPLPERPHIGRGRATVLGFLLLSVAPAVPARAQFSPGPLSKVHADLEGATKCLNCHGLKNGGDMIPQCVACHKGIARLTEGHRGIHGMDGRKGCTTCHAEHRGAAASLIDRAKLAPGSFDHAQAGWPLVGKHLEQKCEACHKRDNQETALLALEPKPDAPHGFIGLRKDCAGCHKDPHEGHLGAGCADCHRETGFHDVAKDRFAHEKTNYALKGAHAKVECAKCHDPVTAGGRKPAHETCSACHQDAHAGQTLIAGQRLDCSSCHNEDGFAASTFDRTRHASTRFPLEGKHAAVACEKCHVKRPKNVPEASLGSAGVWIRRPFDRCADCHADAHAGQFADREDKGDCKGCHVVAGWKPSLWGIDQHQKLAFKLEGRHLKVPCRDCHRPDRSKDPRAKSASADPGTAGMLFKLAAPPCLGCHIDAHDGRYASAESPDGKRACASCHGPDRFRPSLVDVERHSHFIYPLEGAHRAVPCIGCHPGLTQPPANSSLIGVAAVGVKMTFDHKHDDCVDCHADPHEGQLRAPCSRCHGPDSFRPASMFVHDRDASFSLAGAHAKVACDRCHPSTVDTAGKKHIRFRPTPITCANCHTENPGIVDTTKTNAKGQAPGQGSSGPGPAR